MKKRTPPSLDTNFDFLAQAYQDLMAYSYSSLFGLMLVCWAVTV